MMQYQGTLAGSAPTSATEAIMRCIPPEGGLYVPARAPLIPRAFFNNLADMSLRDVAFVITDAFLGGEFDSAELKKAVDESFNFNAPLVKLDKNLYAFELFHGPTLTFKDYGARMMARITSLIDRRSKRHNSRLILVATTGNSGAATANGFAGIDNAEVIVLFPRGTLNRMQTAQLTESGPNIRALEVSGTIENCKQMVSAALEDPALAHLSPTGGNSINIVRMIPQTALAVYAYSRLMAQEVKHADKAVYSIPSGNLGNYVAAMTAHLTGMPVGKLIAAVNANDPVRRKRAGLPADSIIKTIAPTMDVTEPSGYPRLQYMADKYAGLLENVLDFAEPVDDATIAATILDARKRYGYTPDPHSAVALAALSKYSRDVPRVFYATAHPARNLDIMTRVTGAAIELPVQLLRYMTVRRRAQSIAPTYPALKKYILTNIQPHT